MFKSNTFPLVRKLFYSLDAKRKIQFFTLIFLNIISSCIEAIAISASYPFLSLLQSPGSVEDPSNFLVLIFKIINIDYEFRSIVLFLFFIIEVFMSTK